MPAPSLLAVELRAGRKSALSRVRRALERHGSIAGSAASLGVSKRTLEDWAMPGRRCAIPGVCALVDELGMRVPTRGSKK